MKKKIRPKHHSQDSWEDVLKYIKDDSHADPTKKVQCKYKDCITLLNQERLKMGEVYCTIHVYQIAMEELNIYSTKSFRKDLK